MKIQVGTVTTTADISAEGAFKVGTTTDSAALVGAGGLRFNDGYINYSDGLNWFVLSSSSGSNTSIPFLDGYYMRLDATNQPTTGTWKFLDGTSGSPSLNFTSNTSGGIWRASAADNILGDGFPGITINGGADDYIILNSNFIGTQGEIETFTASTSSATLQPEGNLILVQPTGSTAAMLFLKDQAGTEEWSMLVGPTSETMRFGRNLSINAIGSATTTTFDSTDNVLVIDQSTNRVSVGSATLTSAFNVGSSNQFQVNSSGNIVKLNNVTQSWPSSQGSANTVLTNNGSGTLSWSSALNPGSLDGYANVHLSNLSAVAINTALLPVSNNTIDLGSSSLNFRDGYFSGNLFAGDGYGDRFTQNGFVQQQIKGLTYSSTVNIDFATSTYQTVSLTGNVTFTTSNLLAGRSTAVLIRCDSSTRNLTFPSWTFLGISTPLTLTANKAALLILTAFGNTDANVYANYSAQL